jgi:protein phosphatase PTC7
MLFKKKMKRVFLKLGQFALIPTAAAAVSVTKWAQTSGEGFRAGSCYIPHPEKRHRGGEDAHFYNSNMLVVCDGVSSWYEEDDVDAGNYALHLVEAMKKDVIKPLDMLKNAHSKVKTEGSATICIARLDKDKLQVCNLGDSGIKVYREIPESYFTFFNRVTNRVTAAKKYRLISSSQSMRHNENRPYQIGTHKEADDPSLSMEHEFNVRHGDIVVAGTDGLWDANLDISDILNNTELEEPSKIAWQIGTHAYQNLEMLGTLDDITVIVAKVE